MNNWQAIGYIFLGLGMVLLFVGISIGLTLNAQYNTLHSLYTSSLGTAAADELTAGNKMVMYTSMVPFVGGAVVCWIVAVVGLVAGIRKGSIQTLPPPP